MAKQRWVPDPGEFTAALDELEGIYKDIVHEQTAQALAGHNEVLERMRRLEKSIGPTTARITKQMKTDYTPIARESQQLSQTLAATQAGVADTMETLRRIDKLLPAQERLLGPPNRRHYPHLHRVADGSASKVVPDLVESSAQRARPRTQLNRESANAASANAAKADAPHD